MVLFKTKFILMYSIVFYAHQYSMAIVFQILNFKNANSQTAIFAKRLAILKPK